jgi:hypothetical protein
MPREHKRAAGAGEESAFSNYAPSLRPAAMQRARLQLSLDLLKEALDHPVPAGAGPQVAAAHQALTQALAGWKQPGRIRGEIR